MGTTHVVVVAVLVVVTAGALAARLRLLDISGFLLAAAVLAAAEVVGVSLVLSLFHWLTRWAITAAVVVLAATSLLAWWRAGAPRPKLALGDWRGWCRQHVGTCVLLVVVGAALGFQLWMGWRVPPNESDSLNYHLPRAVAWMHHHSALRFPTATPELVDHPINGELFVTWTMALSHGDRLANAAQWCFAVALGGAVAAGARLLGFRRSAALLAAGGFLAFPEVLVQSATTQVDLVVTFFVAVTSVFAARAVRGGSAVELILAAVAFGLALGTKELTFFAVPGLVLIVGASWWRYRPPLRLLVTGVGAAAAAVVAFGSFNYVQNLVHTGKLNGGLSAAVGVDFVHAGAIRDLARVSSTLLDAPGLPGASTVDRLLEPLATRVVGTVHGSYYGTPPPVHTEVDDSESGYGLLGLLVLVPIVVIALWRGPAPQRFLALGALIYLVLFAARMGYAPVAPRLLLPAAALVAPLLARLDDHRPARWAMVAVALAGVGPTLTLNTHKPLLLGGERSVLRADRVEAQLIDGEDRQFIPAVKALNRLIPAHGKLGMVGGDPPLTYVLYDAGLRRDVVSLDASELDPGALRRRGFLGAFVWPSPPPDDCSPVDCPPVRLPASAVPLPGGAAFVGVAGSAGQG